MVIKNFLKKLLQKFLPACRVDYVTGTEALPLPFSAEEERDLVVQYEGGNEMAGQQLIEHNLRLVVYVARKFDNTGVDLDDLVSIGTIGLIKAVRSPSKYITSLSISNTNILSSPETVAHLR